MAGITQHKKIDTSSDLILEAVMEKRATLFAQMNDHLQKAKEAEKSLHTLDKVIMQMQGRERGERSDKGKKRNPIIKKPLMEVVKTKGRQKQDTKLTSFDKNATFEQKVVFAIKTLNKFSHNREIAEYLFSQDPSVSADTYVERLSARASRLRKAGAFIVYQVGGNIRNSFYGFKEWLDANGHPKEGYQYDHVYLAGNKPTKFNYKLL